MDARTFLQVYGAAEADRVADAAGISRMYLRQLASVRKRTGKRWRTPSLEVAERLERASGGRMTRLDLRPDVAAWAARAPSALCEDPGA